MLTTLVTSRYPLQHLTHIIWKSLRIYLCNLRYTKLCLSLLSLILEVKSIILLSQINSNNWSKKKNWFVNCCEKSKDIQKSFWYFQLQETSSLLQWVLLRAKPENRLHKCTKKVFIKVKIARKIVKPTLNFFSTRLSRQ